MLARRTWRLIGLCALLASLMTLAACVETSAPDPGDTDDDAAATPEPTATPSASPTPEMTPTPEPTPTPDDGAVAYEVLASEKTLPPQTYGNVIEFAEDDDRFAELWAEFQLDDDPPEVDWERHVVLFFGTGESGSCPLHLMDVTYDAEERVLTAEVSEDLEPDTVCTDDWTPRVFVVAVDAGHLADGELHARLWHPDRGPFGPGEDDQVQVRE
jgi:hypothetical protein